MLLFLEEPCSKNPPAKLLAGGYILFDRLKNIIYNMIKDTHRGYIWYRKSKGGKL